jgi:predicted nucleotidyltransferase
MTATSFDFSKKTELRWLTPLVSQVRAATQGASWFLAGATARDLLFQHAYGIPTGRQTQDVDFAVMVESWETFQTVRARLIASQTFTEIEGVLHRLGFRGGMVVDLMPFGAIERQDRTIAWPPDHMTVMGVFGFREALSATITLSLPGGVEAPVVSIAGFVLLKLTAWVDRRTTQPGKDAPDIALALRYYLDAGNGDRLYTDAAHLLGEDGFDYDVAGAWLLGHDIAALLPREGWKRVVDLVEKEADPNGRLSLVGDMQVQPDNALKLIQGMRRGLVENPR